MAVVEIKIGNDDITEHIIYDDAEFVSAARGRAGTARFRIRDLEHVYSFSTGDPLTLDIDGVRKWGGYVGKIERGYFFEADCTCKVRTTPRYLLIDGVDYNVLLQKRILYDKVDPTVMNLTRYPVETSDQTILLYYLANHTDLLADGVTTDLIESVGTPFVDDFVSGQASWNVDDFLRYLTSETGAIYYIDPDKALVLTDVDTPNAPMGISDDPDATEVGCRDLEIDFDGSGLRNDVMAWGLGGGPTATPVFSRVEDAASIAAHGRWQVGDFNPTVFNQTTVDRIADSYVYGSPQNKRGGKDDRTSVICTVFEPIFRVAQKVALRSDVFGFSDVIPIRSETITFDTPTDPRFRMVLGHDIDDPWTTFEYWFPPIPEIPEPIIPEIVLPSFTSCPHRCEWQQTGFSRYTFVPHNSPYNITLGPGDVGLDYGDEINPPPFVGKTMSNWVQVYNVGGVDFKGGSAWREWGDLVPDWDTLYIFTLDKFHLQASGQLQSRVELVSGGFITHTPGADTATLTTPQGIFIRFSTTAANNGYGWHTGGAETVIQYPWSAGREYAIRIRLEGAATDLSTDRLAKMKIWETSLPEPIAWAQTRVFPSSPPALTMVGVSGWQDLAPYSINDYDQVTFDYIGPYHSGCSDDFRRAVEDGTPYCLDTFSRSAIEGWGTNDCGLTWLVDTGLGSNPEGAYVDGAVGHLESEYEPFFSGGFTTEGPSLSLPTDPDDPVSIWQAKMRLTCIARGSRNVLEFVMGGAQSPFSGLNAHRVSFTLDPIGDLDRMTVSHADLISGGGFQSPQLTFVDGRSYDLTIIVTDGSTMAYVEDLTTGEVTQGLAGGTKPLGDPTFHARLYQGFSPDQGELPSHFVIDNLELRALGAGLENHTATCPPDNTDAPCSGHYLCEPMSPLVSGLTYESSFQWVPGTDEVWVDGLRIDYRDYTPYPELKYIELGETLAEPSTKTVTICYFATCTGE